MNEENVPKKKKNKNKKRKKSKKQIEKERIEKLKKEGGFDFVWKEQVSLKKMIEKMIDNNKLGISGLAEDCWSQQTLGKLQYSDSPPIVRPFVCPYDKRIIEGGRVESSPSWGCYWHCRMHEYEKNNEKRLEHLKKFKMHMQQGRYDDTFRQKDLPKLN